MEQPNDKNDKTKVLTSDKKLADLDAKYQKLIAVLNKLGYYPKRREEAKKLAKALLKRGYTEG